MSDITPLRTVLCHTFAAFLLFLFPITTAASDWAEPERELAAKIVGTTGPGMISLDVVNRATFSKAEIDAIRRGAYDFIAKPFAEADQPAAPFMLRQ